MITLEKFILYTCLNDDCMEGEVTVAFSNVLKIVLIMEFMCFNTFEKCEIHDLIILLSKSG
jgi:hypothetical protein